MNMEHMEIDRLYENLKIKNNNALRTNINCGSMERRLNANFSAVSKSKGRTSFSSNTRELKL